MTFLLEHLNVPVVGYSLPAEKDSLFDRAERIGAIPEEFSDIREYAALERFIDLHTPSTIIHMAAQPLVLKSYENPRDTFDVNVMGTVNVLDIAFKKDFVKAIIIVTTDKVYRNDNSGRAFIETDPLEGKDPYSASKVGTEAVVAAWQQIARVSGGPVVVSVRAGNVIGGGDFARDRIIPDLVRGIMDSSVVTIRNSSSTRPWLHVLDPLNGYILLLEEMIRGNVNSTFNFSPEGNAISVDQITSIGKKFFQQRLALEFTGQQNNLEAQHLSLDSSLAQKELNWRPNWSSVEAINKTMKWWMNYIDLSDPRSLIQEDIGNFYSNS
jgi:CDP-glucose 4,6-dehydratase